MYKVISTFSGVGGSSLGYRLAGFKVIAAIEFLDYQANNYRINNKNTKLYYNDIRQLDPLSILKEANLKCGELDILDGSPPCAAFSICGKRENVWGKVKKYGNKKQKVDDLFFEFIRFLDKIQPKVFIAENVTGLVKGKNAIGYFKLIFNKLEKCGYNIRTKVLNSKYYKVPQSRQRLFFIGVRKDLNIIPSFPLPIKKLITVNSAFLGVKNTALNLKNARIQENFILPYLPLMKPGESASKYNKKGSYFNKCRIYKNRPAQTITQTKNLYHYKENRHLTIPELKRLMSFPDNFILEGSFLRQWEACGRSVPPNMMKAIALNIKHNILNKLKVGKL